MCRCNTHHSGLKPIKNVSFEFPINLNWWILNVAKWDLLMNFWTLCFYKKKKIQFLQDFIFKIQNMYIFGGFLAFYLSTEKLHSSVDLITWAFYQFYGSQWVHFHNKRFFNGSKREFFLPLLKHETKQLRAGRLINFDQNL